MMMENKRDLSERNDEYDAKTFLAELKQISWRVIDKNPGTYIEVALEDEGGEFENAKEYVPALVLKNM